MDMYVKGASDDRVISDREKGAMWTRLWRARLHGAREGRDGNGKIKLDKKGMSLVKVGRMTRVGEGRGRLAGSGRDWGKGEIRKDKLGVLSGDRGMARVIWRWKEDSVCVCMGLPVEGHTNRMTPPETQCSADKNVVIDI